MAAKTNDELDEKIERVLEAQTVLQRELVAQLEAHVKEDAEILVLVKGIDTALRGDLKTPGLVSDVAALKTSAEASTHVMQRLTVLEESGKHTTTMTLEKGTNARASASNRFAVALGVLGVVSAWGAAAFAAFGK